MKTRLILALIVLVVGAFLPMSSASTWTSGEQIAGAPPAQPRSDELVDARRAAGEAGSQVGFLTQGTTQLKDGTVELQGGLGQLAEDTATAQQGAQELSNGMNALSGGLAEIGSGANQVADGVGAAVDTVVGFEAIKGQIIGSIDRAVREMEGNNDPEIADTREALLNLRGQVEVAQLPEDIVTQLNQLRDGSRDIANQLATPGYDFYDGMYLATRGSMDLSAGLTQLRDGTVAARDGSQELADGAEQVNTMATNTDTKIEQVSRAIPGSTEREDDTGAVTSMLSPLVAMLIAAVVALGGMALACAAYFLGRAQWWIIGAGTGFLTVIGLILLMVLGAGLSPVAMLIFTLALALGALASAGLTWVLLSLFGLLPGVGISAAFLALQAGVVGWTWRTATTGEVARAWEIISGAMPLHWTTTTMSAAGNGGSAQAMWIGLALSVTIVAIGASAFLRRSQGTGAQPANP